MVRTAAACGLSWYQIAGQEQRQNTNGDNWGGAKMDLPSRCRRIGLITASTINQESKTSMKEGGDRRLGTDDIRDSASPGWV